MPDWPITQNVESIVISGGSTDSLGPMLNAMGIALASAAHPEINRATFVPFSVQSPMTVVKMFTLNGSTINGNVDVGIYDANGVRLVSSGSTAHAGASVIQEFNITDTLLLPGLYYLAIASDSATATFEVWSANGAILRSLGVVGQQTTGFPLPATATFALLAGGARVPFVSATLRSVV
jgi:hypothetical protein